MIDRTRWKEEIRSTLATAYGLDIRDGWKDLVCDLVDRIEASGLRWQLSRVAEHFGGLSFRTVIDPDDVTQAIIDHAEDRSWYICEKCGAPGSWDLSRGWAKVLCPPCYRLWDEESWQPRIGNLP